MNISHFRFILFKLKIFGEIVTTINHFMVVFLHQKALLAQQIYVFPLKNCFGISEFFSLLVLEHVLANPSTLIIKYFQGGQKIRFSAEPY